MKLIDLTGKRFGRLFVIKRISNKGKKWIHWLCRCDCGVVKSINGDALKNGGTKSCGCLKKDLGSWNRGITGNLSHSWKGFGVVPRALFRDIQYKAKSRNLFFNLSIEFLNQLYKKQNGKCAISGIDIEFENGNHYPSNPCSLDRIDSTIGYIENNVQWVDRKINYMKHQSPNQDFIEICKIVAKFNS